jgi:hypothetical protein
LYSLLKNEGASRSLRNATIKSLRAYRPAKNTVILIVINNIKPKEEVRGFPKASKKVPNITSVIIMAQAINVIK